MPFTCVVSCCNSKQKKAKKKKTQQTRTKRLHFTDDVFRYLKTTTITTTRAYNYHKHA